MKKIIHLDHSDGISRSYSAATILGSLVFPCGQVPVLEDGSTPEDIFAQTQACLTNLSKTLIRSGSSISEILQTTVYLARIEEFEEYDRAWNSFFSEYVLPPRTTLFVAGFRGAKRIEVTCIAAITAQGENS